MAVDWDFLTGREGYELEGYVPSDEEGNLAPEAGVTVGIGVDLAHQDASRLERLGLPKKLVNKLKPYFGKKGEEAISFLKENPLRLEDKEAKELSNAIKRDDFKKLKSWYNANSKTNKDWSELTDKQQTVLMSVAYHYGTRFKKAPNFKRQILEDDWAAAAKNLRNFGDRFKSRRIRELQYLIGANVDGIAERADGQPSETDTKLEAFVQNFEEVKDLTPIEQRSIMFQQQPDPNTGAMVPRRTDIAARSLQETVNPAATQAADRDFMDRLAEGLRRIIETPETRPQEPTAASAAEEQPAPAEQTIEKEEQTLTEFEKSLISGDPVKETEAGEEEEELTDFEKELIGTAQGTEETEKPVFAETTEDVSGNGERDPIFGLF